MRDEIACVCRTLAYCHVECTKISGMRMRRKQTPDSARTGIVGYITVVLSMLCLFVVLWAVIILTRLVFA